MGLKFIKLFCLTCLICAAATAGAQTQGPPFSPPTGTWISVTAEQMQALIDKAAEMGVEIQLNKGTYTKFGKDEICTAQNADWLLSYFQFDMLLGSIGSFFGICEAPNEILRKYLAGVSGRIASECMKWQGVRTDPDGVKTKTTCTYQNQFGGIELDCDGVIDICELINPEIRIWKNSDGTYEINAVYDLPGCTCQSMIG